MFSSSSSSSRSLIGPFRRSVVSGDLRSQRRQRYSVGILVVIVEPNFARRVQLHAVSFLSSWVFVVRCRTSDARTPGSRRAT